MRHLLPLGILGLMLMHGVSHAATSASEEVCAKLAPHGSNAVQLAIPGINLDESHSTSEDMAVMSGLYNEPHRSIGGLTTAQPLVEYVVSPNMAILPDRSGVCVRPSLQLTLGYSELNVYMDREIPRASCIYNAIFAHEMHHVAIYKDYLAKHLEQFRGLVDQKFNGRTYFFPAIFEAKQYVDILGQVLVQRIQSTFFSEVFAEQHALDTLGEYTRMQSECGH